MEKQHKRTLNVAQSFRGGIVVVHGSPQINISLIYYSFSSSVEALATFSNLRNRSGASLMEKNPPQWTQMYKTIEEKHKMSSYWPHGVKCPSVERRGSPLCLETVTLTPCSQNIHREAQVMVRWQEPDWWLENVIWVSVNIGLSGKKVNFNFEWTLPLTLNLKRLFEIVILKTYSRWSPLSQTLD